MILSKVIVNVQWLCSVFLLVTNSVDAVVNLCHVFHGLCKYCKLNLNTPTLLLDCLLKQILKKVEYNMLKYVLMYI